VRLHLVRHPRPDVADGTCYGSADLAAPFDDALLAQLLTVLPRGVPLYYSPLRRCADLAQALAAALGCPAATGDARLAEMHFGAWEMRAWDDIPRDEVDAWNADLAGYRPGGGESVLQVARRVRAFREELLERSCDEAIVVCHAGIMRLLLAAETARSAEEMARCAAQQPHAIAYGAVRMLDCG